MTEKIINATPHAVLILDNNGGVIRVFPKSNGMIRLDEDTKNFGKIDGIPISSTTWGETPDVPKEKIGTYYIVSQLVKNALPNRIDLLVPKGVIRDDRGNIIGCTTLDIGEIKL